MPLILTLVARQKQNKYVILPRLVVKQKMTVQNVKRLVISHATRKNAIKHVIRSKCEFASNR
ncbi:Uncharacterised protein [Bacteroides heparinolyticus]|uniref:Uncharacterized protein n=1 Tax=Prevotella heparinolytica TaxID=28113 RepID=A0A449I0G2_9BACE|nr:Uncharacterised protein [Bacteroides heparinolyticus]